ncbi:MAG: hypothetical protein ABSB60_03020 [Terracidiphilus sp.]|jgi:hypothetical protein
MALRAGRYASELRRELMLRSRLWARNWTHVESYGNPPVIVYSPEDSIKDAAVKRHGNFFDPTYAAIVERPDWARRLGKIHTGQKTLPKAEAGSGRRWRELDSSMSSDALLMNVFCTPGVIESKALRHVLGVEVDEPPVFGWKARVPLKNGHFDRTEVDMRLGSLLVEAKLTESDFQTNAAVVVEGYRDFDVVFDRELLPRVPLATKRRRQAFEFPEDYSQEFEETRTAADGPLGITEAEGSALLLDTPAYVAAEASAAEESGYESYQLVRNALAAYALGCSFCVIHDERRPDLREAWFEVMAAVKSAEMRVRLKVLTWQEVAAVLPEDLQEFLDLKYGIVAPGRTAFPVLEAEETE